MGFEKTPFLRQFDHETGQLTLSKHLPQSTINFQLLFQLALHSQNDLFEATLDFANFTTPSAREIAKLGLANYFAGAALMPSGAFLQAAQNYRHDLELLSANLTQASNRLPIAYRPCNARAIRVCRFSLCGWIRQEQSPSAIQQHR